MKDNTVNVYGEMKEGNKWVKTWETEDPKEVYKRLSHDLVAKKICKCTYISSISRSNLYNGFERITVYYDNGTKATYTVEE